MQTFFRFLLVVIGLSFIGGTIWFITQSPKHETTDTSKPLVATTIFPLYDITQNIAGELVDVSLILPPGASPHTFEASPSVLRTLSSSDVVYAIGYGLDDWIFDLSASQNSSVYTVDSGISIRSEEEEEEPIDESVEEDHDEDSEDEEHEDEHGHGPDDPHYWLAIENAQIITQNISQDLAQRYPTYAEAFAENAKNYLKQLEDTQSQLVSLLEPLENKNIVTFHDAWYYFAESLNLNIVGTFEPSAGREPTPRYLAELAEGLEQAGTYTIFSEPQFGTANLESFANDNNILIVELDPIGGVENRASYIDVMIYNAQTIAQNN